MADIRKHLLDKLVAQKAFWSYDESLVRKNISDDALIETALLRLDLDDIDLLFAIYPKRKIKGVWREAVVPRDDRYHATNRMLAVRYFDVKAPERYLKATITRHINKMTNRLKDF